MPTLIDKIYLEVILMNIPLEVKDILNTFHNNGYEAFIVGGCVRDHMLGIVPKDYDITTNALPEEIITLFPKTIPTGIKHGTITVMVNNNAYEVTTYRIDGDYKDNRHPEEVKFVTNIKEDLSRRDFTINALAYNEQHGLKDFFNGQQDLKNKIIRSVGISDKRFNEDALRMLRAIRFSCQLDFQIHVDTLDSIKNNFSLIKNISIERIRDEFSKILLSSSPSKGLLLLETTGILKLILPELQSCVGFDQKTPYHDKDVFMHALSVVDKTPSILHLRLAALFHDISKPQCFFLDEKGISHFYGHPKKGEDVTRTILKRLKYDNETINKVCILVREHMNVLDNPKDSALKRLLNRVGKDIIFDLFKLQRADILSSAPPFLFIKNVDYMDNKISEIIKSDVPLNSKQLAVDGNDLIKELSIKPGKIIGNILNYLLDRVLDEPTLNTRENLLSLAKEFHGSET